MAADFWRLALRQMQVRAFGLEERVKEMVDVGHDYFSPSACLISCLVLRPIHCLFLRDETGFAELQNGIVHQLHPLFLACLNHSGSMKVLPSRIRFPTAGLFIRISMARHRPVLSARGTSCWLMIPRRDSLTMTRIWSRWSVGKYVQHTVQRAGRAARMNSAKHEVAGLGSSDCERDRLQVAHFTDHNDVGVLAECPTKRGSEGDCVRVNLALSDMATF